MTNLSHGWRSIFNLQQQLHDLPLLLLFRAQRGLINLNLINTQSDMFNFRQDKHAAVCLTVNGTSFADTLLNKFDAHQEFVKILDVIRFEEGEVS